MADQNIAAIALKTDRYEYSRFESDASVINARLTVTAPEEVGGVTPAEKITVSLVKHYIDGRSQIIDTQEVAVSGNGGTLTFSFDLNTYKDSDGLIKATRGRYTLQAITERGELTASAALMVVPITVDKFRRTYLYGMTLYAAEQVTAVFQPSLITGVTVTGVSSNVRRGTLAVLTLVVPAEGNPTLKWGNGPATTITASGEQAVIDTTTQHYMKVTVDLDELNAAGTYSETIILDQKQMSDADLRAYLETAINTTENGFLGTFIEPRRVATKPYFNDPLEGEYFDVEVPAVAYYMERSWNIREQGFKINLPLHQLQRIDEITGYMGNTKVLGLVTGAYAIQTQTGDVSILPFNSQYAICWNFFSRMDFFGLRDTIPNFWNYKGVVGIKEMEGVGDILQLIMCEAAVQVKTVAGSAYKAGCSSESISKDGVSKSVSYTSSATFGIYSADIEEHRKWLDANRRRIRNKWRGIPMVVL